MTAYKTASPADQDSLIFELHPRHLRLQSRQYSVDIAIRGIPSALIQINERRGFSAEQNWRTNFDLALRSAQFSCILAGFRCASGLLQRLVTNLHIIKLFK